MRMNLWTATISSLFVTLAAIAAPASFDYGDGRHWTGETGQSITVTYTSGGRTITVDGVLEDVKGTYIAVVEETSGRSRTHFIYLTELQSISTEGDEGGGEAQPNTSSGASADLKAVEQGPEAPPAAQEVGDLPRGVFVLPLTDMVGHQFREVEIRQIGEHADKFGPGQMWEAVAQRVTELGGMILTDQRVEQVHAAGERVHAVTAVNTQTGESTTFEGEFVFSTMPVKDLIRAMGDMPPQDVKQVSEGLVYRDFLTVGLLLGELRVRESSRNGNRLLRDNWIYIQEPDVRLGRLQIFNNWSPHMVAEPDKVWLGLEYFCNEGDDLWTLSNEDMVALGIEELERIDIIDADEVCDSTVIRMPKAYPAYFGTYDQLGRVRAFADSFKNLYLIGRNGQHRYNNQDHSMLAAMTAVDNIAQGRTGKENVWAVNAEQEYHERK